MTFKLAFTLLAIGVVVAGVIPFGMSQVQEDAFMEIEMLPTQVENPFRIQNHLNEDVFAINTEGHPVYEHPYRIMEYYDTAIHTVDWVEGDITGTSHEGVLAEWTLSNPTGREFWFLHDGAWGTANLQLDAGTFCWVEFQFSANGGTSYSNAGISFGHSNTPFAPAEDSYYNTEWNGGVTNFRIIEYAGGVTPSCQIVEHSLLFPIAIAPHIDLVRVK